MSKRVVPLLSILLLILIFLYTPHAAFAQSPNGLDITLSPSAIELSANPGDTIHQKFRVRNNTDTSQGFSITLSKINPQTASGQIAPIDPQPGDITTTWFTFESTNFIAPSREWKDVSFDISIPSDAAFSYAFAIRISQTGIAAPHTIGAKLVGEVILPVLINVKAPGSKAELKLISFAPVSVINEYLPINFALKIANTGNIFLRPQGDIFIRTSTQADAAAIDVNPAAGAILPDGSRVFTLNWNDGFFVKETVMQDGNPVVDAFGKPKTRLKINWDKLTHFRIGRYTATALVVYDNGTRDVTIESTTSFWVFPYTLFVIIISSIIGFIILIRAILNLYIRHELKKRIPNTPNEPIRS